MSGFSLVCLVLAIGAAVSGTVGGVALYVAAALAWESYRRARGRTKRGSK